MNRGLGKRFWTWCQSRSGRLDSCGNLQLGMRVYGLENLEAVDHDRPILLVANHRSFFDFFTVSSVLVLSHALRQNNFSFPCAAASSIIFGWHVVNLLWVVVDVPAFFSGGDKPNH